LEKATLSKQNWAKRKPAQQNAQGYTILQSWDYDSVIFYLETTKGHPRSSITLVSVQ